MTLAAFIERIAESEVSVREEKRVRSWLRLSRLPVAQKRGIRRNDWRESGNKSHNNEGPAIEVTARSRSGRSLDIQRQVARISRGLFLSQS